MGPAVKAVLLCLLIGGSGVGYVWQKTEISRLGEQTRQGEQRLEELRRQNEALRRVLAGLTSPKDLDARVKKLNLGLAEPQADQIVRLSEFEPEPEPVRIPKAGQVMVAQGR